MADAEDQLDGFLRKYDPEVEAVARDALVRMRTRIPGAAVLVYDNYNALALAFAPTEKSVDAPLSIALYPRWVSLFFRHGAGLPDPHGLLEGSGSQFRHIRLPSAELLADPRVDALIAAALAGSNPAFDANQPDRLIIKSVSDKQRPRRP
jgi:hypothetical protein